MQKMDAIAPQFQTPSVESGGRRVARIGAFIERLSDQRLSLAIGAVLFALSAWPLALVELPPLQDLPNHLAAVTIISNPEHYPEFVANGFLKTNAALFGWLCLVGKVVGVNAAARLFALLVLGLNAVVLPQFILHFTNRRRLMVASFFIWPAVHNWFVSMGMLDFALGVPLSLLLLILADRQRLAETWKVRLVNGALMSALSLATWYAHVFTLMVAFMLLFIHAMERRSWRERALETLRIFTPVLPAILLTAV